MDFARTRLLGTLDAIEKTCREKNFDVQKALAWRPGPGRAHIAWQAMHCAATHDKYVNVNLKGGPAADAALVAAYGGGSTPADDAVPGLPAIRAALEAHYRAFREYVSGLGPDDFGR